MTELDVISRPNIFGKYTKLDDVDTLKSCR